MSANNTAVGQKQAAAPPDAGLQELLVVTLI